MVVWTCSMKLRFSLFYSAFFLLPACEVASQEKVETQLLAESKAEQNPKIRKVAPEGHVITGRLTNEGVVCPAMRGDNGELYVFTDLPEGLNSGDELRVERKMPVRPVASHCDQGQVLKWVKITKLVNGAAGHEWRKNP